MNILIPMAGRGKRFAEVGYKEPKPFIDVNGKKMIDLVLSNLIDYDYEISSSKFIFFCLEDFLDKYQSEFERYISNLRYEIISVKEVTDGMACTALLAKELINNQEEIIISDCDHIVEDQMHIIRGVDYFRSLNSDGGLWCFLNNDPKWSYVRMKDNEVIGIYEKQVVSCIANTGTYYFKRGSDFVQYAETMIKDKNTSKGEYYVAPVYNYMLSAGLKINPFLVNNMIGLGTPEDLKNYLQ